jgi:hypothetical protein
VLPLLAEQIRRNVPGIETIAPYHILFDAKAIVEKANAEPVSFPLMPVFAGSDYFSIMNYKWLRGSSTTCLKEPFTVVLILKKAQTYFGPVSTGKMVGRTILYND